ncbi:hypothetical protein [Methylocaldum sp.]|uniref:hypothetical protein n=1 Tax=Methylocaldum sp. TaxID=1969727 RepID=UPI002D64FB10|nr:hypothetical protein [Methylocaldum sp.]HYE38221.1 hypothetical protein [Methylocaldum sp.]
MSNARQYHTQQIHYLRKDFTYADDGLSLTVGTIPAGSVIVKPISGANVSTAFNAGSTNVLDIGISGDLDLYATDLALGSAGYVPCDEAVSFYVSADTTILATVDLTGTAASAGVGQVVIAYIPNL